MAIKDKKVPSPSEINKSPQSFDKKELEQIINNEEVKFEFIK